MCWRVASNSSSLADFCSCEIAWAESISLLICYNTDTSANVFCQHIRYYVIFLTNYDVITKEVYIRGLDYLRMAFPTANNGNSLVPRNVKPILYTYPAMLYHFLLLLMSYCAVSKAVEPINCFDSHFKLNVLTFLKLDCRAGASSYYRFTREWNL